MDNYLETGGVLPSGLLSGDDTPSRIAGFNKTYKNYSLRAGVVSNAYAASDPNNFTKLTTEYDVLVFEQNEDRGNTVITYRNCISSDGFGSIADFFEKNYRPMTVNNNPTGALNTTLQNGSIVLLECLDAVTEKAIIIGGLPHPDRPTTLTDTQPRLQGEYNGVNVAVNPDGSTALTFNGATDNYGNPTDSSQGVTTVQIATDGSFSVALSTTTFTMSKSGDVTITSNGKTTINAQGDVDIMAQGDANVDTQGDLKATAQGKVSITSQGDVEITAQGDAKVTASGTATVDGSTINLGASASHPVILGDMFVQLFNAHLHTSGPPGSPTTPPIPPIVPTEVLSMMVNTE